MEINISIRKNASLGTFQLSVPKKTIKEGCKQLKRKKQKQRQKVESGIHANAELEKVNKEEKQKHIARKAHTSAAREYEARPPSNNELSVANNVQNFPKSIVGVKIAKALKAESGPVDDTSRSGDRINKRNRSGEAEVGHTVNKKKQGGDQEEGNTVVQKEKAETSSWTRKQRRNHKKNNSKKNKFRHLILDVKQDKGSDGVGKKPDSNSLTSVKKLKSVSKASKSLSLTSENHDIRMKRKAAMQNLEHCHKRQKLSGSKSVQNVTKSKQLNLKIQNAKSKTRVGHQQHPDIRYNSLNLSDEEEHSQDTSDEDDTQLQDVLCNKNISDCSDTEILMCPVDKIQEKDTSLGRNKLPSIAEKAREKLNAARFRYLNEQLYTSTGKEALEMFQDDPEAFQVYHHGFQSQVSRWPVNPLDVIIKQLGKMPNSVEIADFGCGDARLAESLPQHKVYSFDLVATKPCITVCDIAKVPLEKRSVDVAVFCLSLMGTNLTDYLCEANRVIRTGGILKIAEVVSRFYSINNFVNNVQALGFHLQKKVFLGEMFQLFTFRKVRDASPRHAPHIQLKVCHYKRR